MSIRIARPAAASSSPSACRSAWPPAAQSFELVFVKTHAPGVLRWHVNDARRSPHLSSRPRRAPRGGIATKPKLVAASCAGARASGRAAGRGQPQLALSNYVMGAGHNPSCSGWRLSRGRTQPLSRNSTGRGPLRPTAKASPAKLPLILQRSGLAGRGRPLRLRERGSSTTDPTSRKTPAALH